MFFPSILVQEQLAPLRWQVPNIALILVQVPGLQLPIGQFHLVVGCHITFNWTETYLSQIGSSCYPLVIPNTLWSKDPLNAGKHISLPLSFQVPSFLWVLLLSTMFFCNFGIILFPIMSRRTSVHCLLQQTWILSPTWLISELLELSILLVTVSRLHSIWPYLTYITATNHLLYMLHMEHCEYTNKWALVLAHSMFIV